MAQKIRRQTRGVRQQARAQAASRRARNARSHGQTLGSAIIAKVPLSQSQWQRLFTGTIFAAVALLSWTVASVSGALDYVADRFSQGVADAGFKVVYIEPRGIERADEDAIYEQVWQGGGDLAMTDVDLVSLRKGVRKLPWVDDARVSRQLPNVLVVDVIEHRPHAVLQQGDALFLVDREGLVLERVSPADAEGHLVISGEGARAQIGALAQLLGESPAMRAQVKQAQWVGERRWDLVFGTGQKLALPDGATRAAAALMEFARADGMHRLIGGEVASFDMRNPPRVYLRVPGQSDAQELDTQEDS